MNDKNYELKRKFSLDNLVVGIAQAKDGEIMVTILPKADNLPSERAAEEVRIKSETICNFFEKAYPDYHKDVEKNELVWNLIIPKPDHLKNTEYLKVIIKSIREAYSRASRKITIPLNITAWSERMGKHVSPDTLEDRIKLIIDTPHSSIRRAEMIMELIEKRLPSFKPSRN